MIMTTTSSIYNDRFNIPWFLLHKYSDWYIDFIMLIFELIDQLYLSHFQDMFFMVFILILYCSSSQKLLFIWWNMRICYPILMYCSFNTLSNSIFVWFPTNDFPTRKFIICIYLQPKFVMFVQCFSWGS